MPPKSPELEAQQRKLNRVLEAIALLGYNSIGGMYYSEAEKAAGYRAVAKYKVDRTGCIDSVCFVTYRTDASNNNWADGYSKFLYGNNPDRPGLALKKLRETLPKVSSKTRELEVVVSERPGIEAIAYANDILEQELGMTDSYQTYTINLEGVAKVSSTVALQANGLEDAKAKALAMKNSNWYVSERPEKHSIASIIDSTGTTVLGKEEPPEDVEDEDDMEMEA
jgi:hypothetical protein